ncbi:uncharacterized protein LOC144583769 isoform X2 [Pogona vitticeps]
MKNLWLVVAALLVLVAPASATREREKRAAVSWRPSRFSIISSMDHHESHPKPEPTFGSILLDEEVRREPGMTYDQPLFERFWGLIHKNPDLEETSRKTEDQQYPF